MKPNVQGELKNTLARQGIASIGDQARNHEASNEPPGLIDKVYACIGRRFRARRAELFLKCFMPTRDTSILDVGGYPWQWEDIGCGSVVTILNPQVLASFVNFRSKYRIVVGDGTDLQYGPNQFDIVYSNSVIEHLGTLPRQQAFAREVRRVGRRLWIQTPARSFIIEPHLLTPVIHWLPRKLRKRLIRRGTIWGLMTNPTIKEVEDFLNEVRLLSFQEMTDLFPDCYIHRETFMGLTKSFIAIRN